MRLLDSLLGSLRSCLDEFPDKRRGINTSYGIGEIGMAAFSVFFMQSPSFLAHQRQFEAGHGRSNCTSLFGLSKVPSDNHIRDMLDPASPTLLHPMFAEAVGQLERIDGGLDMFRRLGGRVLIALDGTEYHCSRNIHCPHCSTRLRGKGETEYFHAMLAATLVAPGHDKSLPLRRRGSSRWSRNSLSRRTGRRSRIARIWPPSAGLPPMEDATRRLIRCFWVTICSPANRSARRCWTPAGISSSSASRHRIH